MKLVFLSVLLNFTVVAKVFSQKLTIINQENPGLSFRGISVVDEDIFWLSADYSTLAVTSDGGNSFDWIRYQGYGNSEFRDIYAFSNTHSYILNANNPASILETTDGGKSFEEIYIDDEDGAFLDDIDCTSQRICKAIGDPLYEGQFYIVRQNSYSWKIDISTGLESMENEYFNSPSGSILKLINSEDFIAVSGGNVSRMYSYISGNRNTQTLPIIQGDDSKGAFSLDFDIKTKKGIIVGGDQKKPTHNKDNAVLFEWNDENKNFTFSKPKIFPNGYRSSVAYLTETLLVACGSTGIDISYDGGINWSNFSKISYNVVKKINSYSCLLAGEKGKISILRF